MKILVCGGRTFDDYYAMATILNAYPTCTHLVYGGAAGADCLADRYASEHALNVTTFVAKRNDISRPGAVVKAHRNGTLYDAAAGAYRNRVMLEASQPDLVVAFPGGAGTADMTRAARKRGTPVVVVTQEVILRLHAERSA